MNSTPLLVTSQTGNSEAHSSNLCTPKIDKVYRQVEIRKNGLPTKRMGRRQEPKPSSFELTEVIPQFLDGYRYGSVKTLKTYQDHVERAFMNYMKARSVKRLDEVTPALIREYLQHELSTGISMTTLGGRYTCASTFFRWCEDQEFIQFSPFRKVRRPKMPTQNVVGFSAEEAKRLVKFSQTGPGFLRYRDHAVVLLLLDTGARANELLCLTEKDIDWPRRRLQLHGKGAKDRWVPLGPDAHNALRAYLRERPKHPAANIWLTQRRTVMDYGTLNMMLKNLGEYAGVDGVRPHRFRHTYASQWYEHHQNIMALKNLLGHSKVETTQRYLRSLGMDYGTGHEYSTPSTWLK